VSQGAQKGGQLQHWRSRMKPPSLTLDARALFIASLGSIPPRLQLPCLAAIFALCPVGIHAQEHHERHHANYQNWVNQQDKGCCNDQDCGELREEDERNTRDGVEVRIEGQWCSVQSFHYLKRGNAPDWATSHVCVLKYQNPVGKSVCERLLCYQPKPGT
jgi:hypothetical protein